MEARPKSGRSPFEARAPGCLGFALLLLGLGALGLAGPAFGAGARLVDDINQGGSSHPSELTNVGGTLMFTANDGTHGRELWKSHGTSGGTGQVLNVNPGAHSSSPGDLTNVDLTLFFAANDGTHGRELWKSDGTRAGTQLVRNINTSSPHASSFPQQLTNVRGVAFFVADDGVHGTELWKSDGTRAGTKLVKDIRPGARGSDPSSLTNVGGELFFSAQAPRHGRELWESDGTAAGTRLVRDINPGTDGSYPYDLTNVSARPLAGGTLFFAAYEPNDGTELWKSDGTKAGTRLVRDINPTGDSAPGDLTNIGGLLMFDASDGSSGFEPWRSEGTRAGTQLVKDINPGTDGSYPLDITRIHGEVIFWADDGVHGTEPWYSDGSGPGTNMAADINPGAGSSEGAFGGCTDCQFTNIAGTAIFWADDGNEPFDTVHGTEPWSSDPGFGTQLVADINPGQDSSYAGGQFTNVADVGYFAADDGVHGAELWKATP